jgi:hypothetical protein
MLRRTTTEHKDLALAFYHFAVAADRLNRCSNFHDSILLHRQRHPSQIGRLP